MVARAILVLFLSTFTVASDVIQAHETVDGIVPGLGKIEGEGVAGAQFGENIEASSGENGSWEGNTNLNPEWNKALLLQREEENAKHKREQLRRAILLQRTALEEQEKRERAAEDVANGTIDDPEVEVEDGYVVAFQPAITYNSHMKDEDGMLEKNQPPPPFLMKKVSHLGSHITPTQEALVPVAVVDPLRPGEQIAQFLNTNPDSPDIPTEMSKEDFQSWHLSRFLPVNPGTTELTSEAESNTIGADRVGVAQKMASNIVSDYFEGQEEIPNKEDVVDSTLAWGVMNAHPKEPLPESTTEYQLTPSTSPSPIPSPSPSTAPREVYMQESLVMQKETNDLSFSKILHVKTNNVMFERDEDQDTPVVVAQPLDADYHSFTGTLEHPSSIDTGEHYYPAGLTGMGRETSLQPDVQGLDVATQTNTMNRQPGGKHTHHH